jgi:hypothetical protein
VLEILPAAHKASEHVSTRHVVPSLPHTGGNPAQCQLRRPQPKIRDFDPISVRFPETQLARVRQSTQRRFKGKINPRGSQTINTLQEEATRRERGAGCEAQRISNARCHAVSISR